MWRSSRTASLRNLTCELQRATKIHGTSIRVKPEPSLTPAAGCHLLQEVLLGSTQILRTPEPTVTIKDVSAEMIDFELFYVVADIGAVGRAQNEIFDRIYRAAAAAGAEIFCYALWFVEGIRRGGKRGPENTRTPARWNLD